MKPVGVDFRDGGLRFEVALVGGVDDDADFAVAGAAASAALASPRVMTVREQMLLGVLRRGSTPLVKTARCSIGASAAIAAAISMTAGSGS